MTDSEFLKQRSDAVRKRLRRRSAALQEEIDSVAAPLVRAHPRTGLAAGAVTGFLLGRALASVGRGSSPARRGPIAGTWRFVSGTGVYALRSVIVKSLLSG